MDAHIATVTQTLVEFIQRRSPTQAPLPSEVIAAAQRGVLDWLGTALAGSQEDCGRLARELDTVLGGEPQATLIGTYRRTSVVSAALVNGTAGHALDYDDTHLGAGLHATAAVLPATIALAEWLRQDGNSLLGAYVVGFEVATFLGRILGPSQLGAPWHPTALCGTLGAAAASATLLELNSAQTRSALGIAASQAAGLRRNFGSMTKPLHAGKASANGLYAALLAQRGFTASDEVLAGEAGLVSFLSAHAPEERRLINARPPGEPFRILQNDFKLHACCHATHAAVDAMLHLRDDGLDPTEVESVEVACCPGVFPIASRPTAASGLEGKFSLGYCVAVALVEGRAGPEQFTDELVARPLLRDLTARVRLNVDPAYSFKQALVRVQTRAGQQLERYVDAPRGSAENPPGWSDLVEKFHALAGRTVTREGATEIEQAVLALPTSRDCGALVRSALPV